MKVRTRSTLPILVALALIGGLAAGCRDESRPQSPTAPGAATSSISGTLVGGTGTAGIRPLGAGGPLAGVTVTLSQTGQTTRTDAAGSFGFSKISAGAVPLKFERADIHASLTLDVPASSTVTVTIAVAGSTATVVSHDSHEGEEIEGIVQTVNPSGNMLTVRDERLGIVTIETNPSTVIRHGGTPIPLSDIKSGMRVHVRATAQTGGSFLASEILVQDEDVEPERDVHGTIKSIDTGKTLFVLSTGSGDVTIHTDGTTVFEKNDQTVAFSALAVGDQAEVEGTQQTDGSILARKVDVEHPEQKEADVTGTIQKIDPSAHSFVLTTSSGLVTVQTDSSTEFRGAHDSAGSFSDLTVGARVEVEGTLQTDGSVLAKKVKIED